MLIRQLAFSLKAAAHSGNKQTIFSIQNKGRDFVAADISLQFRSKRSFCSDNQNSYYIPLNPLQFKNGRYSIYKYTDDRHLIKAYYLMYAVLGFLSYKIIKKLYNYQDRNFFGLLFYGGLALFITPRLRSVPRTFNRLITGIDLTQNGKEVIIRRGQFWRFTEKTVDISQIVKPQHPLNIFELNSVTAYAFPINIQNDLHYLPRNQDYILDKEVLPAVLNGRYIDTGEVEQEILIE